MRPLKGPTPARRGGGLARQSENTRLSLPRVRPGEKEKRIERKKERKRPFHNREGNAGRSVPPSVSNSRLMRKMEEKKREERHSERKRERH